MKKYVFKYLIFLLPFLAVVLVELFVLPIDFFAFRVWESLLVRHSFGILKGPFYPNMTVVKTEAGDLKPPVSCAIMKKDLVWQTDAYGYRKASVPAGTYPVIVVGDSNAVGSGLSQKEMFSEVLEKRVGKKVYPLAPESVKYLFKHRLLRNTKPQVVILEIIERNIMTDNFSVPGNAKFGPLSFPEQIIWSIRLTPAVQAFAVYMDRAFKANLLQFVRARINSSPPVARAATLDTRCPILFLQGEKANREIPDSIRREAVIKIKILSDFFTEQGIRFVFLPIPNKENIYYRELDTSRPVFLEKLIAELSAMGVEVADTQKAFEAITYRKSIPLYHRDDTHWNAAGAETAAVLVEKIIATSGAYGNKP
jgi:hypothetical protein